MSYERQEAFRLFNSSGQTYVIYADGRTEGFPEGFAVVNKIPAIIRQAHYDGRQSK